MKGQGTFSRTLIAVVGGALLLAAPAAASHEPAITPLDPAALGDLAAAPATADQRLAETWCGERRTTDDTTNETGSRRDPKIKVIHALPADVAHDPAYPDTIQSDIRNALGHLAAESGDTKSLRFDLGTSCGPAYVDIQTISLPRTWMTYASDCLANRPGVTLFADLGTLVPRSRGVRNYLVYVQGIDLHCASGQGQLWSDDRAGQANPHNSGGLIAVLYDTGPALALHEMGHTLGAVQLSAPNNDGSFHCKDNVDILCYGKWVLETGLRCQPSPSGALPPFDCGKDDYFSPAPAPGSYLATHWNLYESVFLCAVAECVPTRSKR